MKPRKEDLDFVNKILELYLQDEIQKFDTFEISRKLSIEYEHARFLRDLINELNLKLSFFRVERASSGDFYPLEDGKFLIRRFIEDGGSSNYFEETFSQYERALISKKIDDLVSGQIHLAVGQMDLSAQLSEILPELKLQLTTLNKKVWKSVLRDAVLSAGIGLAVNTENLELLVESAEKSLGI